jgi:hypothetical protein
MSSYQTWMTELKNGRPRITLWVYLPLDIGDPDVQHSGSTDAEGNGASLFASFC